MFNRRINQGSTDQDTLDHKRRCKRQTFHLAPTAEGATPYVQLLGPTVLTAEDGITGPAAAVRGGLGIRISNAPFSA